MRRGPAAVILTGAAAAVVLAGVAPAGAAAPGAAGAAAGSWGSAYRVQIPSQKGASAGFSQAACAPKGYCAALGLYSAAGVQAQSFVITRTAKGTWSKIRLLGRNVGASELSCPSAGNCVAAGYRGPAVSEKNGTWGKPVNWNFSKIGGGGNLPIGSLACTSAGNCVAGGTYQTSVDGPFTGAPFVISERNGTWRPAEDVPGIPSTNVVTSGAIISISCAGTTCLAIGGYGIGFGSASYNFAVTAVNGIWGKAKLIPGLTGKETLDQVSCSPGGTCTIAVQADQYGYGPLFTLSEHDGTWDPAPNYIPGTAHLAVYPLSALSCPAAGDCTADGSYVVSTVPVSPTHYTYPFVVTEHDGIWTKPQIPPGLAALTHGQAYQATVGLGLPCSAPGTCAAGGFASVYLGPGHRRREAIVLNEDNGTWHWARVVPGIVKLSKDGLSSVDVLACASAAPGHCIAGGSFEFPSPTPQKRPIYYPFVVASN